MDRDRPMDDQLGNLDEEPGTGPGDSGGTGPGDSGGTGPGDSAGGQSAANVSAATEREVALRLIGSRAVVDAAFFEQLRSDPRAAVEQLHITLDDDDIRWISGLDWDTIDQHARALREEVGRQNLGGGW